MRGFPKRDDLAEKALLVLLLGLIVLAIAVHFRAFVH
jgi:hypothetical protein